MKFSGIDSLPTLGRVGQFCQFACLLDSLENYDQDPKVPQSSITSLFCVILEYMAKLFYFFLFFCISYATFHLCRSELTYHVKLNVIM